jgi:hypothetical protein
VGPVKKSAVLDEHQDVQPRQQHGVHVQEVKGEDPGGLGMQELPATSDPSGAAPDRCPAARRISQTVDGAIVTPSFASSPWIWRYPHSGFSFARRTAGPPGQRGRITSA